MGALRGVYQLKPQAVYEAAFLRVRSDLEQGFSENYLLEACKKEDGHYYLFENVVAQVSKNGRVLKFGMIQADRILERKDPGIYLLIQSMNKRGLNSDFREWLRECAHYLDDQLFYVLFDTADEYLARYEIKNGELHFRETYEMQIWKYDFGVYIEANYASDKQLLADFFTDKMMNLKTEIDDMLCYGSDPDDYYEREEYEEFLEKLERYTTGNPTKNAPEMIHWLKGKIANYESKENQES